MSQFISGLFSLLASLVVILLFAWVARALLDARELTWRRLIVAAFVGVGLGSAVAAFLLLTREANNPGWWHCPSR